MKRQLLIEVGEKKKNIVYVPDNCWAFNAETKQLITEKAIPVEQARQIVLVPKIAGG